MKTCVLLALLTLACVVRAMPLAEDPRPAPVTESVLARSRRGIAVPSLHNCPKGYVFHRGFCLPGTSDYDYNYDDNSEPTKT